MADDARGAGKTTATDSKPDAIGAAKSTSALGPPQVQSLLRAIGSLWFAAVLLILCLVAMANATVFEMTHGTEHALAMFYKSWWFRLILALLGVNVLAALIARFPFTRRQIGFVLTHVGILAILGGALVTKTWGVDGRISIVEGESVSELIVSEPVLMAVKRADGSKLAVDLPASVFAGFRAVDRPSAPVLRVGATKIEVLRYLPDSERSKQVLNDNPRPSPAIEVIFAAPGEGEPFWVAPGKGTPVGSVEITYRRVVDRAELERLLSETRPALGGLDGLVKVEFNGETFDVALQACLQKAAPLGDTGYAVRVLRYMPHATVGPDNKLVNDPRRDRNPAIEVEVAGPGTKETRKAFSRFPEFSSMHGGDVIEGLKVTFVAPTNDVAAASSIEVLSGPGGELHVRFSPTGADFVTRPLEVGMPVESPWPGMALTVARQFDRARVEWSVVPVEPVRERRTAAVLVRVGSAADSSEMWIQKHYSKPITIDKETYDLVFSRKTIPLGFEVTLNSFKVGYYPGEGRPRSFESRITIVGSESPGPQSRLISMNNPTTYGGYTFYQSSYDMRRGRTTSVLSVARDPGKPVVFTGYITTMVGMIIVLTLRMVDQRRMAGGSAIGGVNQVKQTR